MGWGDPKLLAMIGAFIGAIPALPFVLFVSCLVGAGVGITVAVLSRRNGGGMQMAVPFGPFLAFGAVAWVLEGPGLIEWWFPGIYFMIGG
jgi:leader peptidase (prepilin peptidase)/N-methyltransferase